MKKFYLIKRMIGLAALMVTISAAAFSVGAQSDDAALQKAPDIKTTVRVGLSYGSAAKNSVSLSGEGGFTIEVDGYEEEPAVLDIPTLAFTAENGTLHVRTLFGGEIAGAQANVKIKVSPVKEDSIITYNEKTYRGGFELYADLTGNITVINVLDIEEYLRGVLPSEVYASWNMEALKAAAVTARTYALRNAASSSHSASGFDVCATTHCQMYSGASKEHERTDEAIRETAGLVVKFNGALAMTPYHSSNGGYTESAAAAWGGDADLYPYLSTVYTPFEDYRNVPNGKWESIIAPDELENFIPEAYAEKLTGGIADLAYTRAPSGFIEQMTVTDGEGNTLELSTSGSVRSFFGTLVKSANFDLANTFLPSDEPTAAITVISADGEYELTGVNGYTVLSADGESVSAGVAEALVIDGCGYGHGVGLSQFGSRCMADAGFTYEQILETYFPGTSIEPLFAAPTAE